MLAGSDRGGNGGVTAATCASSPGDWALSQRPHSPRTREPSASAASSLGTLELFVDRSPHKQGRFLPGVRGPIFPSERFLEVQPDRVLLLAWNLSDEVLARQEPYRNWRGRFIVLGPTVSIL
jgi:hypothetical protein